MAPDDPESRADNPPENSLPIAPWTTPCAAGPRPLGGHRSGDNFDQLPARPFDAESSSQYGGKGLRKRQEQCTSSQPLRKSIARRSKLTCRMRKALRCSIGRITVSQCSRGQSQIVAVPGL